MKREPKGGVDLEPRGDPGRSRRQREEWRDREAEGD